MDSFWILLFFVGFSGLLLKSAVQSNTIHFLKKENLHLRCVIVSLNTQNSEYGFDLPKVEE